MILAGERVRPSGVRLLATMVDNQALATRLVAALDTDTTIFALTDGQCDEIITALDESTPGELAGLRGALVRQRDARAKRLRSQARIHQLNLQARRGR